MKSYKKLKQEILKDKETKKAYNELGPEFKLIEMIIERRVKQGLTQAELAEKINTKQSAISRFEKGNYNPTINFLNNIASALGIKLKISFSAQ